MKWEQDLVKDIRYGDYRDDIDDPRYLGHVFPDIPQEFSLWNQKVLSSILSAHDPKTVVEIGVHRNGDNSSTSIIHKIVPEAIYLGVDLEDKSYLNSDTIHTVQCDSSDYQTVVDKMSSIGMTSIDLLFIDGWHSINQVLKDWEYTKLLSNGGIVVFHDTSAHPGPKTFLENLNKNWRVELHCEDDYGIGYCYAKA